MDDMFEKHVRRLEDQVGTLECQQGQILKKLDQSLVGNFDIVFGTISHAFLSHMSPPHWWKCRDRRRAGISANNR